MEHLSPAALFRGVRQRCAEGGPDLVPWDGRAADPAVPCLFAVGACHFHRVVNELFSEAFDGQLGEALYGVGCVGVGVSG